MKANDIEIGVGYPIIFTTGAFLTPVKIMRDGIETWRWIVAEFVDDSYHDGQYCNPVELALDQDKLFNYDKEQEEP